MTGRIRYTENFKSEALSRVVDEGQSVKDVSQDLGVTQKTIYDWLKKQSPSASGIETSALEQEILMLKAELAKVKAEKEILKQAAILIAQRD